MYMYYEIKAKLDGDTVTLYGSFVRDDCVDEIEAERESWRAEGYRNIKIASRETADSPDKKVYKSDMAKCKKVN